MQISYEKKMAPLEAGCCFMPFSPRPQSSIPTSQKLFKNNHIVDKTSLTESQKLLKERKQGVQAMKKSISSINLKRKFSDGHPTNRISLNQSQFVSKPQKRFVTHSMDSQSLKYFFPHYQSSNNLDEGRNLSYLQDNKNQHLFGGNETLDSLAQKFKKSRNIQIQNYVEQTKKHTPNFYPNQGSFQAQNLQKTSTKQLSNPQNPQQIYSQLPQESYNCKRQDFRSPSRLSNSIKNPEEKINIKATGLKQFTGNQGTTYPLNLQMNQVDSMIIEVNRPKNCQMIEKKAFQKKGYGSLGHNKQTSQSKHFGASEIAKTRKRSLTGQRNLSNYDTMTVNSDYEEQEHERMEKIEESAIMMNFFNPPSFIKEKLGLSSTKNH